jgi:hypothetical protein
VEEGWRRVREGKKQRGNDESRLKFLEIKEFFL